MVRYDDIGNINQRNDHRFGREIEMMNDLVIAKNILNSGNYTCVISQNDSIYTSTERGVKPLMVWLESKECFKDFCAADKVVGKATAFLYVLSGVKALYAHVISKSALQVLTEHHIATEYDELVENIINRQGNGICPFEAAVLHVTEPATAYETIRRKMSEMNITI